MNAFFINKIMILFLKFRFFKLEQQSSLFLFKCTSERAIVFFFFPKNTKSCQYIHNCQKIEMKLLKKKIAKNSIQKLSLVSAHIGPLSGPTQAELGPIWARATGSGRLLSGPTLNKLGQPDMACLTPLISINHNYQSCCQAIFWYFSLKWLSARSII